MTKLAIDAGHGYVKGLGESGARVLFPSLICVPPASVDLGEFGKSEIVTIDGQPFLVGEPARAHATPLWSREKAADPDTLRLILVAAAQLGVTGPVTLATGLPLSWFGSQKKAFREALLGYGATVQLPEKPPQRIWIESVKVLPQGLAAAAGIILYPDREPGDYAVVDIGYRTSDFVVVTKSSTGKIQFDPALAGSLELGTHAIAAEIAQGLESDYHVPFKAAEVEEKTRLHVEGQAVELAGRRTTATEAIGHQLHEALAEKLDQKLSKLAGIVLVGGGAVVLGTAFPQAVVMEEAQWANAGAYLESILL